MGEREIERETERERERERVEERVSKRETNSKRARGEETATENGEKVKKTEKAKELRCRNMMN